MMNNVSDAYMCHAAAMSFFFFFFFIILKHNIYVQ